jgi:hypothetical protein
MISLNLLHLFVKICQRNLIHQESKIYPISSGHYFHLNLLTLLPLLPLLNLYFHFLLMFLPIIIIHLEFIPQLSFLLQFMWSPL